MVFVLLCLCFVMVIFPSCLSSAMFCFAMFLFCYVDVLLCFCLLCICSVMGMFVMFIFVMILFWDVYVYVMQVNSTPPCLCFITSRFCYVSVPWWLCFVILIFPSVMFLFWFVPWLPVVLLSCFCFCYVYILLWLLPLYVCLVMLCSVMFMFCYVHVVVCDVCYVYVLLCFALALLCFTWILTLVRNVCFVLIPFTLYVYCGVLCLIFLVVSVLLSYMGLNFEWERNRE